jgi:hypothetical protein
MHGKIALVLFFVISAMTINMTAQEDVLRPNGRVRQIQRDTTISPDTTAVDPKCKAAPARKKQRSKKVKK